MTEKRVLRLLLLAQLKLIPHISFLNCKFFPEVGVEFHTLSSCDIDLLTFGALSMFDPLTYAPISHECIKYSSAILFGAICHGSLYSSVLVAVHLGFSAELALHPRDKFLLFSSGFN